MPLSLDKPIEPSDIRVEFDPAVCNAIGLDITKKTLLYNPPRNDYNPASPKGYTWQAKGLKRR